MLCDLDSFVTQTAHERPRGSGDVIILCRQVLHTHSVCLAQWKGCSLVPFVRRDQETHRHVRAHIHPEQGWGETPFAPPEGFLHAAPT